MNITKDTHKCIERKTLEELTNPNCPNPQCDNQIIKNIYNIIKNNPAKQSELSKKLPEPPCYSLYGNFHNSHDATKHAIDILTINGHIKMNNNSIYQIT